VEKNIPETEQQLKEDLKALQNEGQRCARIVQGVLNFARENKPKYEEFDFSQLMRETAAIFEHRLRTSNVDLVLDVEEPLIMQGDSSQLQQVLVNVVINSLHASQPGSKIYMIAKERDGKIMAEVLDSGNGISDDNLARAFSPFFTTKPEGSGTGLGLSVSYGIIRKHGGSIVLENRPEGGVRVEIILPKASQEVEKETQRSKQSAEVGNAC
jgi:two-component system NtrC family sensor kinase